MADQQPQLSKLDQISIQSPTKHPTTDTLKKSQKSPPQPPLSQPQPQPQPPKPASSHLHSHSSHPHPHSSPPFQPTHAPLYQQTYYLTGLRQNYLVLISDNMHIIQLPVGLLKGNIVIGDPIKLKLEIDGKKMDQDRRNFVGLQEGLLKEFGDAEGREGREGRN